MKTERMRVPSRITRKIFELVNAKRKKDGITWPELMEGLLNSYLKNGAPKSTKLSRNA